MNYSCDDSIVILDDVEVVQDLTSSWMNRRAALCRRKVKQNLPSKSNTNGGEIQSVASNNETPILVLGNKRKRGSDCDIRGFTIPVIEILSDDEHTNDAKAVTKNLETRSNVSHLNKRLCENFMSTDEFKRMKSKKKMKMKNRKKSSHTSSNSIAVCTNSFSFKQNSTSKVSNSTKVSEVDTDNKKDGFKRGQQLNQTASCSTATCEVSDTNKNSFKFIQPSNQIVSSSTATTKISDTNQKKSSFKFILPSNQIASSSTATTKISDTNQNKSSFKFKQPSIQIVGSSTATTKISDTNQKKRSKKSSLKFIQLTNQIVTSSTAITKNSGTNQNNDISKFVQPPNQIASSSNATTDWEIVCSLPLPHPQLSLPLPPHLQPSLLNNLPNTDSANFRFPILCNPSIQPNFRPTPTNTSQLQLNFSARNYSQTNNIFANQYRPRANLRPIAIDGSNVAFSHGNNKLFSCKGIQLCIDYFLKRGHSTVKAFVPQFRRNASNRENVGTEILERLSKGQQYVVFTPTRTVRNKLIYPYDDRFILDYACQTGAIVVSNDNFRDLLNEKIDFRITVENRLLMYTFVDDCFLVPEDPMGKGGPVLDHNEINDMI
uniref:RNase NYN domain-containing protein n=1 Tax=Strigamia maritima TaxID=126957 RepID=T1J510_STRMM